MKAIAAIYKDHVFKPLEEVELEEDTKVVIRIERDPVEDLDGLITIEESDAEELIEIKPLDLDLMFFAEEICRRYLLRPHDAILVATLKSHGIENIATNDPDFDRVAGIKVWKP